jgi:hypothetical protein
VAHVPLDSDGRRWFTCLSTVTRAAGLWLSEREVDLPLLVCAGSWISPTGGRCSAANAVRGRYVALLRASSGRRENNPP